ncbi:MAG: hypothetical protein R2865_06745 [Deinococcales bacterium]
MRLKTPLKIRFMTSRWSWQALRHIHDISKSCFISPIDLEAYFMAEGLYDETFIKFADELRNP